MEGQIISNRYELLEKIGGGGMAIVYKAKCKLLNRFVAVKMLRPEFTNDDEFVKRFRVEAQSAASLSHPNIVSIYDVGQEDEMHYIIMEYIDGVTLKDYISRRQALNWREAVKIAIQICSAIDQAHRNHIVHRDIKPHNILLTSDGSIVKVTDFGIARAVSSSTITMVGSTIGSVHYFSPEQARGGYTDEKSDLYSIGVVLYEMVTGKVPFDGDTPVAVALKHIQVEAQEPISLNRNIPNGINEIIMKAIKKEQNNRYQSASDMLRDLHRVLNEPEGGFVIEESIDNSTTKRIKVIGDEQLTLRDNQTSSPRRKEEKKKDKLTVWLAVITSVIIMAIFTYIGFSIVVPSIKDNPTSKDVEIKDYSGRNIEDVRDELTKDGINVKDTRKNDEKIQKDIIITQKVAPGNKVKPGGSIEFVVSDGPRMVKMVDLRKMDYRQAESTLNDLKLVAKIEDEFSETITKGLIIRTDPAMDEEIKVGTAVKVVRSKGPEIKVTKVPDLVGKTRIEAQKLLSDSKLTLGKVYPEDSKNYIDIIIKQEPAALTDLNEGSPVNIQFEVNTNQKKVVNATVSLTNPETYGEKIKLMVESIPSDTNKPEVLVNEMKNKTDFPMTISIPVPENGNTKVNVFLDDKKYVEFTQDLSGGR